MVSAEVFLKYTLVDGNDTLTLMGPGSVGLVTSGGEVSSEELERVCGIID
jgi:hypothetical protein